MTDAVTVIKRRLAESASLNQTGFNGARTKLLQSILDELVPPVAFHVVEASCPSCHTTQRGAFAIERSGKTACLNCGGTISARVVGKQTSAMPWALVLSAKEAALHSYKQKRKAHDEQAPHE